MIQLKRLSIIISSILCVTIIGLIGFKSFAFPSLNYKDTRKIIVIDAGHGGFDGGAVSDDQTSEKNINLNIALNLKAIFEVNGYKVIMTRTDDSSTDDSDAASVKSRKKSDLANRLELMSKSDADLFISIHLNKFTSPSAKGAQIFYTKNFPEAKLIAQSVQNSVSTKLQPENRRLVKPAGKDIYLLNKATIPAVIVECGFLSNNTDLTNLKNEEYQKEMAFAVFCGIIDYYSADVK